MNHLEDFIPYGRQRVSEEDIEAVVKYYEALISHKDQKYQSLKEQLQQR